VSLADDIVEKSRGFVAAFGGQVTTVRVGPEDAEILAEEFSKCVLARRGSAAAPTKDVVLRMMRRGDVRLAGMQIIIDENRKPGVHFFTNG
jgi:hypothetical protein